MCGEKIACCCYVFGKHVCEIGDGWVVFYKQFQKLRCSDRGVCELADVLCPLSLVADVPLGHALTSEQIPGFDEVRVAVERPDFVCTFHGVLNGSGDILFRQRLFGRCSSFRLTFFRSGSFCLEFILLNIFFLSTNTQKDIIILNKQRINGKKRNSF